MKKGKNNATRQPLPSLTGGVGGGSLWWLPVIGLLLVAGFKLVLSESEMLLRAQELNLWLPTGLYWKTMMQYPGGAASWCATYLTQYFFHPWLGVGILCGLWLIICLLLAWIYRLKGPWMALTVLVPLALMACFVQTGYWIYYQKLQGHLFVPTIGVLFATLCLAVQRLLDDRLPEKAARWARLCWMAIVCIAGYPFFGAWALGATGLLGLFPRVKDSSLNFKLSTLNFLPSLVLIAAVPQIYYQLVFEMTERSFLYVAALPSFRYSAESFEQYRMRVKALPSPKS